MSALDYITIKGFKSIQAVERLELRPINVLIGANGSGKSNFIEAFSFLREIRLGHLQEYVARAGGADRLLHFGSKSTDTIHLSVNFNGKDNRYGIDLRPTDQDTLAVIREIADYRDDRRRGVTHNEWVSGTGTEASISTSDARISSYVRRQLDSWRRYHVHDTSAGSPMKKTGDVNDNRFLRDDGANLAAFLYLLKTRHEAEYSLIRRTIRMVAPFLDDFILEPLALNEEKIRLQWKHTGSDAYFDAASLSDGTLRFIALATLLLQPLALRPSVILIDEPELGLHPYAITLLASLVKQASVQTQVILSTQSSVLLDHFEPEDVLVADRVEGATQLTRLSAGDLEAWLADYSLGQLWEKNEIGGRPGGR